MASRQKEDQLMAALESGPLKPVLVPASIVRSDFGGGRHGVSIRLFAANGQATTAIDLVERKDGTYQIRTEPMDWVLEAIEKAGFDLRKPSEVGAKDLKIADED